MLELQVLLVQLALLMMVLLGPLELEVKKAKAVFMEIMEQPAQLEHVELLVIAVHLVHEAYQDFLVIRVCPGRKGTVVRMGLMADVALLVQVAQ